MQLDDEIRKAVKHQTTLKTRVRKSDKEVSDITEHIIESLNKKTYDFSKADAIIIKKNGKKRFVKLFTDPFSTENILSKCIKQVIDNTFKVKYPNRNRSVRALFDIMRGIKQMSDFTIIKFDFKNYFNSVSAEYVYEKYLKHYLLVRESSDLVKDYVLETKYAFAGLCSSNVISEIIAQQFDLVLKKRVSSRGVIFYERYIDDSIIIFNEHFDEQQFKAILNETLNEVFFDETIITKTRCKTDFNISKYRYIAKRALSHTPMSIDYLGYQFSFDINNSKCNIIYGITAEKRKKNEARIDEIINAYALLSSHEHHDLELLRHRIFAFCSRSIYVSKKYKTLVWKAKGFISNYNELRFMLDTSLIDKDTEDFLKKAVEKGFLRAGMTEPYFIKGSKNRAGYNLFHSMKANSTLLLVDKIGYDISSLRSMCEKIGINLIDSKGKPKGYGTLVRDYLIRVKVGY